MVIWLTNETYFQGQIKFSKESVSFFLFQPYLSVIIDFHVCRHPWANVVSGKLNIIMQPWHFLSNITQTQYA